MMQYRKVKGYRRGPGRNGRPVYMVWMSRHEIRERRLLIHLACVLTIILGGAAVWLWSMI